MRVQGLGGPNEKGSGRSEGIPPEEGGQRCTLRSVETEEEREREREIYIYIYIHMGYTAYTKETCFRPE